MLSPIEPGGAVPESQVLIIMTGGTICMKRSEDGFVPARDFLPTCLAPRPSFNDGSSLPDLEAISDGDGNRVTLRSLRTPISTYRRRVRYCVLEFETLLDSSSIDSVGWTQIARTIERNYRLFDGFVVLHGTDSLAYTCAALSYMLQSLGKPVIFTGSQAPMTELQNDATDNLLGSLVIAGHFMIPEVCLFFHDQLFRGNRATKVSATDFEAFASPNFPALATINSLRVNVRWHLVRRPKEQTPFSVRTEIDTALVACLRIFPGIKPEMVDAVLRLKDLKGLVLETFGAGNTPGGKDSAMTKVLASAIERGVVIVNVTQCLSGAVSPLYAPATHLGRAGVVFGHDMTSEAALTKLAYLLALPDASYNSVTAAMSSSLRGELTESSRTFFHHPDDERLSEKHTVLSALGYKIAEGDEAGVKEIVARQSDWFLNEADYSGNTPVHLASTSPNVNILRFLLAQGASVHVRNRAAHTALFLAARAGMREHVSVLRAAGAHLYPEEMGAAKAGKELTKGTEEHKLEAWIMAGVEDS